MKQAIFIGLNHDQVPYLNELKNLGYFVIGIDKNNRAPGCLIVDKFLNYAYDDCEIITSELVSNLHVKPKIIFTAAAQFSHVLAARLAAVYSLNYPSLTLINKVLDKGQFYKLFTDKDIPIPPTEYLFNADQLRDRLQNNFSERRYFLKSDFSKNPRYVYSGSLSELNAADINWTFDTFLRTCYVLQPEMPGVPLRINVYDSGWQIFNFDSGLKINNPDKYLVEILKKLWTFSLEIGLGNWIVKFDIIYFNHDYVALDIGIDPPSRMKMDFEVCGKNFEKFYLAKYIKAFE